jgi:hypothetical protein
LKNSRFNISITGSRVSNGSVLQGECEFVCVKIFFLKDNKFSIFCPKINGKLIPLTFVFGLTDDYCFVKNSQNVTEEVKVESKTIFEEFYKNNKKLFIGV